MPFLKKKFGLKSKALRAIRLYSEEEALQNFVRGQYGEGQLADQTFAAYRDEPNVAETSSTETLLLVNFN